MLLNLCLIPCHGAESVSFRPAWSSRYISVHACMHACAACRLPLFAATLCSLPSTVPRLPPALQQGYDSLDERFEDFLSVSDLVGRECYRDWRKAEPDDGGLPH